MLSFKSVSYRWPHSTHLCLETLSFHLNKGEQVALIGDNGAGKSTLLRVAAGLLKPSQGEILLAGESLSLLHAGERSHKIGLLFQEPERQIFHHTVWDEIAFGLRIRKMDKSVIDKRINSTLETLSLTAFARLHPLDLDAGQKRMVAVASLAVLDLSLLLLDEPSRDFDHYWLTIFERWLATCCEKNITVMAISHDRCFVQRNFSRLLQLKHGRMITDTFL